MPADEKPDASDIQRLWDARARSPYREFYVASHRGWDDAERAEHQARFDLVAMFFDVPDSEIDGTDVLEIGCGSGRLAAVLAPRVARYRGFDISAAMVDKAKERLAGVENAEVYVGDGERVPEACAAHRYDIVFSHAVLIHCPRDIIASNVRATWPLVAPGGRMRLQLLADADDPTGIRPMSEAPTLSMAPPPDLGDLAPDEQRALEAIEGELSGTYYMGHAFRYDELEPFLRELAADARISITRFEPHNVYVELRRDEA